MRVPEKQHADEHNLLTTRVGKETQSPYIRRPGVSLYNTVASPPAFPQTLPSESQVPTSACQVLLLRFRRQHGRGDHQTEKFNMEESPSPSTVDKKHPGNQSHGVCLGILSLAGLGCSFLAREDS